MDPRFTTGTCKALLSAIGIWVDSKSISIDEVFDSEGLQESWADHFNPVLVTVVDGVIVVLVWECDGTKHFAFCFRLDAHAEATRIHHLRQATQWAKEKISNADIVFFAGDRNFCPL